MVKQIKREYTDHITCPYCEHEDLDSWEHTAEDGEIECGNCGKTFTYTTNTKVTYTTSKLQSDCAHESGFEMWSTFHKQWFWHCDECDLGKHSKKPQYPHEERETYCWGEHEWLNGYRKAQREKSKQEALNG
ncbi:MAG TPA: hypothetical protein VIR31_02285 [Nitrososphaeraceae archaeon]